MRNTDSYRRSPRPVRTVGVGFDFPELGMPDVQTVPSRHFPDVATNIVTPERVSVDLTPYGEREVIDGRD